jgi:hypothetical protein
MMEEDIEMFKKRMMCVEETFHYLENNALDHTMWNIRARFGVPVLYTPTSFDKSTLVRVFLQKKLQEENIRGCLFCDLESIKGNTAGEILHKAVFGKKIENPLKTIEGTKTGKYSKPLFIVFDHIERIMDFSDVQVELEKWASWSSQGKYSLNFFPIVLASKLEHATTILSFNGGMKFYNVPIISE